ncbi:MAG: transport-associated protein [uncultured bacterium]|nr:MAG: transport-associated protein [uncultured bacterium]
MKSNYLKVLLTMAIGLLITGINTLASETDDRIESSAKQSYVFKTYLSNDDITIKSTDGAVILTGSVATESNNILAKETVENLPGVKSVESKLLINAEPYGTNADMWIAGKIKVTLLFHRNVNASKTVVEVKDGVVTLTGEASSKAQKELTTEYVADVEGVKEVKNDMAVAGTPDSSAAQTVGEKIDDASITAQVKASLFTHRSTSAVKTKVATQNGEVTVSGVAKNEAEKGLVTKLVSDIQGVMNVRNLMTIEEPKVN